MLYTTASKHLQKLWNWPHVHSVEKSSLFPSIFWAVYFDLNFIEFVLEGPIYSKSALLGTRSLPEPMVTEMSYAIWHH